MNDDRDNRPRGREAPLPAGKPGTDDDDAAEDAARSPDEVFALRKTYLGNGYRPVAVYTRGKRPRGDAWRAAALKDPPLWAERYPENEALSTGILTGPTAAADVDILIQGITDRVAWDIEQTAGTTPLVRIGRAPKTLLCYRCETPFSKLSTNTFIMPDGSEAKVEILGEGQQFVADGIHPDTGHTYVWVNGSPDVVPLSDLPVLTLEQAQGIIGRARELIIANGGTLKEKPKRTKGQERKERPPPPPRPRKDVPPQSGGSFFERVNAAALHNLAAWVTALFPTARRETGTGAWRVKAKDRGRLDLEEDISFHPAGIQDFGEEHGLTAIDAVMEHGGAPDAIRAAQWLSDQLGIAPETFGWRPSSIPDPDDNASQDAAAAEQATRGGNGPDPQPGQGGGEGEGGGGPPPQWPPIDDQMFLSGVRLEDFWAYMPMHKYIFATARDLWPGASVNARLPKIPLVDAQGRPVLDEAGNQKAVSASAWLDKHKPVEQMTWAPGEPMIIRDRLVNEGATIGRPGVSCFNLYLPPPLSRGGDPKKAARWLDHLRRIYPETSEVDHICRWFAHRLQRPAEKPNHALVLGGPQGIGKDTLIEPLKRALGAWNCAEVSPRTIVEASFNGFARSILLRISEARDLGEVNRYAFYEAMKVYTAAPPDVLRVNEKNLREFHILNCCGVVMTTNYKSGGIYLPADDRRHFVAWSLCTKEDFSAEYWNDLWAWYENGGIADVTAYLAAFDLSGFNPKAPPPQTPAFWEIVDANRAPEDSELADLLDQVTNPKCVTLNQLVEASRDQYGQITGIGLWLGERKNRRLVPHRMEQCGYTAVRNPGADDGLWKIGGKRQAIYAKVTLPLRDQITAARSVK